MVVVFFVVVERGGSTHATSITRYKKSFRAALTFDAAERTLSLPLPFRHAAVSLSCLRVMKSFGNSISPPEVTCWSV